MIARPNPPEPPAPSPDPLRAVEMHAHLLSASHDLERLQALLADACDTLASSFFSAHADIEGLASSLGTLQQLRAHLARAITALQFEDLATQLIAHTHRRLHHCADRLAADTLAGDADGGAGAAAAPRRPSPVSQCGMHAGSVELF